MKRNLTNGFPPFIFCNEDKPARCQLIHQQAGKELIRGTLGSFQEKTKTLNVFCIIASTILYSIPNHHTGCPRKKCVSAIQLLEYQMGWAGGWIWYSREIELLPPCTEAPRKRRNNPPFAGGGAGGGRPPTTLDDRDDEWSDETMKEESSRVSWWQQRSSLHANFFWRGVKIELRNVALMWHFFYPAFAFSKLCEFIHKALFSSSTCSTLGWLILSTVRSR